MNRFTLSSFALVLMLAPACKMSQVKVEPARAWTALSGSVAATDLDEAGALRGSTLDDLGLGGRESNDRLSLQWTQEKDRWELFGHSTDSKGSGALADDLHLNGVELRYDEGDVETDLHLGVYGLRWVRSVVERGPLELGLGASLLVAEFDLDLDQEVLDADTGVPTGEHKSTGEDAVLPFPLPMLDLNYHSESFDTRLSLSGLWVWVHDGSGHIIDMDFQVKVPIFDDVGELVCGYHAMELELDHRSGGERARLDVTFSGPYLGISFGF